MKSTRQQRAWYWYDWANSAYVTTTATVILGPYLTSLATNGVQGLQTFFGQVKDTGAFTALQTAAQSAGGGLQSLWNGIMAVVNAMTGGQPAGTAFGNVLNTVAEAGHR